MDDAFEAGGLPRTADAAGTVEFRPPGPTPLERAALLAAILLGGLGGALILRSGAALPVWAGALHALPTFSPAAALALLMLDRRGRTTAGPDGIVNRRLGTASRTPWHEVTGFEVRGTRSGRLVRVLRRRGRPITLAAPADGAFSRDGSFGTRLEALQTLAAAYQHAPPGARTRSSRRVRTRTTLLTLLALMPPSLTVGSWWLAPW